MSPRVVVAKRLLLLSLVSALIACGSGGRGGKSDDGEPSGRPSGFDVAAGTAPDADRAGADATSMLPLIERLRTGS